MEWNDAILKVLTPSDSALSASEIADLIVEQGLRESYGSTPAQTVAARISTSISTDGDSSPFVRIARGQFIARTNLYTESQIEKIANDQQEELEHSAGIQAIGMYWLRESVVWTRKPRILGKQQIGSDSVDVAGQVGVYLLYDGREVIYVGRSNDSLGARLYSHTQGRLRARWDRFSWFGLRRVGENGELSDAIPDLDSNSMVSALEAVLIESLEPRQNRRSGDDFSGIEYIQETDPEIERQRNLELIDRIKLSL